MSAPDSKGSKERVEIESTFDLLKRYNVKSADGFRAYVLGESIVPRVNPEYEEWYTEALNRLQATMSKRLGKRKREELTGDAVKAFEVLDGSIQEELNKVILSDILYRDAESYSKALMVQDERTLKDQFSKQIDQFTKTINNRLKSMGYDDDRINAAIDELKNNSVALERYAKFLVDRYIAARGSVIAQVSPSSTAMDKNFSDSRYSRKQAQAKIEGLQKLRKSLGDQIAGGQLSPENAKKMGAELAKIDGAIHALTKINSNMNETGELMSHLMRTKSSYLENSWHDFGNYAQAIKGYHVGTQARADFEAFSYKFLQDIRRFCFWEDQFNDKAATIEASLNRCKEQFEHLEHPKEAADAKGKVETEEQRKTRELQETIDAQARTIAALRSDLSAKTESSAQEARRLQEENRRLRTPLASASAPMLMGGGLNDQKKQFDEIEVTRMEMQERLTMAGSFSGQAANLREYAGGLNLARTGTMLHLFSDQKKKHDIANTIATRLENYVHAFLNNPDKDMKDCKDELRQIQSKIEEWNKKNREAQRGSLEKSRLEGHLKHLNSEIDRVLKPKPAQQRPS